MNVKDKLYLSLSCIPLPVFIEGGDVCFKLGGRHPNRNDLGYFILIIMKKGCMFLGEDDQRFEVRPNEMFVFLPNHHHFSYRPCEEETEYYWLHFACAGHWVQDEKPVVQTSMIEIPTLHYYTADHTLFLPKHRKLANTSQIHATIEKVLQTTRADSSFSFWQTQQLFIDVLQYIQLPVLQENSATRIALEVERYLRDYFDQKITNDLLASHFHLHPNYICRCMKEARSMTPMQYLSQLRIEEAKKQLLNTDATISQIASQCGFQNVYYFSNMFKKMLGMSPLHYRNKYGVIK